MEEEKEKAVEKGAWGKMHSVVEGNKGTMSDKAASVGECVAQEHSKAHSSAWPWVLQGKRQPSKASASMIRIIAETIFCM
jgi:hypothetical protein